MKQAESSLKALRAELKLNETQMKGTGESVDTLQQREKILQKELEVSGQKVEMLNGKLQSATEIFGENSIEANNWSAKLSDAKRAQEAIAQELAQTSAKIEEQKSAQTQLSAEEQKAAEEAKKQAEAEEQLRNSVSQADEKIKAFDQELQLNETKLEGAKDKTDLLKERQQLLANESKVVAEKTQILQQALDECGQEVGEDSERYAELKSELTEAKIKQEEIRNEIKKTSDELKNQKTAIQNFGEGLGKFGEGTEKVGQNLKVVSTAAAGALAGAGTAAVQFESAFAGVKKTSDEVFDANGKCVYSYQQLEDGIRQMAKEIPASTTEISEVAEAAGQLGIKTQDVLGFTRVMIDMGNSTNLSAEDAATSIAKFANVTGLAADTSMSAEEKYKRMGSTIVDLGNNYATTEADIMNMAGNLASAGAQVGMSESDILALATALSSVGMEAQAGGTAFSKALVSMQLAVETNSDELQNWADVAGMSAGEFATLFKEDATSALEAFIQGLSKCGGETDSAIKVLNDMGITETRMRDALLRSANASDVFTSAIQTGKNAWEENTALTNEASKRYETTASQLEILKNNLYDVGITLGSTFLPMIQQGIKKVVEITDKIAGMSESQQRMLLGIVTATAVVSPLLIGIGKLSTGLSAIIELGGKISGALTGAGAAAEGAGAAMAGGAGIALGPILLVAAGVTSVVGAIALLWKKSESFRDFVTGMIDIVKTSLSGFLDNINIEEKVSGIKSAIEGLGEKLLGLENVFEAVGTIAGVIIIPAIGLIAAGFSTLLSVIEPVITVIGGMIDILSGAGDMIIGVFTGDLELAKQGLDLFGQGVGEVFSGLWDVARSALDGFVSGIAGFFGELIQICGIDTFVEGAKEKFSSMIETVSNIMSTIGNVITVEIMLIGEILSAAFQIITIPFQLIWQNCKDGVIQAWDAITSGISGAMSTISEMIQAGFGLIKTYIVTPIGNACTSVISIFSNIGSSISNKVSGLKSTVQSGFNAIKNSITKPLDSAKTAALNTFESIQSGISNKINGARTTVQNAISAIKSAMNFSWSLPPLKLPHISISGSFSLNPPSVPHFGIDWYAKGAVFSRATIIPTYDGIKGVGEAGPEAVAPIETLKTYVAEAVERGMSRLERMESVQIDYDKLAKAMSNINTTVVYKDREFGRVVREVLV